MSMRFCLVANLLSIVILFSPDHALGKPMSTTFEKLIETSETIAVAKFADKAPDLENNAVDLQILQIIKGDLKPGKQSIAFHDRPQFANQGESFIVFLDAGRAWRFVAHPLNGKKLEEDLLQLDGFYDDNGYFVSPALVTLDQLLKYLKDKTLVYRFKGEVYFPEEKQVAWKAGSIKIKGSYDAVKEVAKVEGLPNLKGFDPQPAISILGSANGHGRPLIEFEYSRGLKRLLILTGKVDSVDPKTGEIAVRFAVQAPEVLTQKAFEEHLGNPKSSGPYYKFKLACKRTTDEAFPDVLFFYEQKSTENYYQDTVLEGYGKTPPANTSGSYDGKALRMNMKTDSGAILSLVFDVKEQESRDDVFDWTFQRLLPYSIYRTTTATGFIELDSRKVATFTATLDSMGMNFTQ